MILETAATTAIVSAAKPLVKPFVEKFVTSKLQDFAKWCKDQGIKIAVPKSEHFKTYLERMYDKCNIVKTMAFHSSQLRLKDIYIPVTLVRNIYKTEPTLIDGVPIKLIREYKKILITDMAGMGKSTILKRIFIAMIDNVQENVGIPIYIELNKLHKGHLIVDEIREELKALFEKDYNEIILNFILSGGFVFFLDGYDEISSDKALVTNDIQDFISKAGPNNYYFLTSRPDASLNSFGDFQPFSIEPLKRDEAFELLKKYDLSENKEKSKSLIAKLRSGKYRSIEEYLGNPLLVSLLFTVYNYRQIVPLKKCNFYRQVYVALFEAHKAAQGVKPHQKHSLLEIDDFEKVLRYIGYECLIRNGVRFEEDIILNSIERAKTFYGNLEFGNSAFLKDLWTTVPLFIKEGAEYSWAHKSLMEYFAALFINVDAKEKQDNILAAIFKSANVSKYGNMLDIYYDIDYKGFSKNITLPICKKYVEFYEGVQIEAPMINEESIDIRKSLLFLGLFGALLGKTDLISNINFSLNFSAELLTRNEIIPWIGFCSELLEAKGGRSLSLDEEFLNRIDQNLFYELDHKYREYNFGVSAIEKVYHKKDIVGSVNNSLFFMESLFNSSSDACYVLKVRDNQMVLEKAIFEYPLYDYPIEMHINMHAGEKHPLFYNAFNVAMLRHIRNYYHRGEVLLLDYKACKREIDDIRKVLSNSENESIMLPS